MPQDETTRDNLRKKIDSQARRIKQAEKDQPTLMSQAVFTGTLGLLFVLPVIGGAYLGNWLDSLMPGYSMRWTLSLIVLGVFIGAFNVYLFLKEH